MTWCLIVDDFMFTFCFRPKKAGRLHKSSSSFDANHAVSCQLVTGKDRIQFQGSEIIVDWHWTLRFSSGSYYSAIFSTLLSIICVMVSGPNSGRRSRDSLTSSYENTKYKINYILPYMRVGTLIVAIIYLQLIQNRYMFRSFTVLQCSHQHCPQPVASDEEVVGYL